MTAGKIEVREVIDRSFRRKRREMVLVLTRKFGTHRLDDIENALQTASEKALTVWPATGVPLNPVAWFVVVAKNLIIDTVRKASLIESKAPDVIQLYYTSRPEEPLWAGPLEDDVLKMMIVCTHPELNSRESVVIILRLICNLSVAEIAKGLLTTVAAVRKQMTRAKTRIRELAISFDLPPADQLEERLERILVCIYLLYNEGYLAHVGSNLIRRDLCVEAERLIELLLESSLEDKGKVWALAALLAFQSSRADARTTSDGQIICIADQDRSLWDQEKIDAGLIALGKSMQSRKRSRYHLEAAITGCHATAKTYSDTDWARIREYYDDLAEIYPSPVVELNRSVAVMMTDGPEVAIELLHSVEQSGKLNGNYLLPALLGDFCRRAHRREEARAYYKKSLNLTQTEPVHQYLLGQMEMCKVG